MPDYDATVGDIGRSIVVSLGSSAGTLTSATGHLRVVKPRSRTIVSWTIGTGAAGNGFDNTAKTATYTATVAGDLDEPGVYAITPRYTVGGVTLNGPPAYLHVGPAADNLR